MLNSSAYNFYFPRFTPCLYKLGDKGFWSSCTILDGWKRESSV